MKRQFYVAIGKNPHYWPETKMMGPFPSKAKARQEIRSEIESFIKNCDALSTGTNLNFCEDYHILEVVSTFYPVISVTAKLSLHSKPKQNPSK
jgi:tRNA1(Val) A37 N6-methylase TrmN6